MKYLLLLSLIFNPVLFEEEEQTIEPTAEPTPWIIVQENNDAESIINYLEEQKELQRLEEEERKIKEEEEKKLKEEEELKELIASNELRANELQISSYTSRDSVINGYANKFRYYWTGQRLISSQYYRYDYYMFVFTDNTIFTNTGTNLEWVNGKCYSIYVPYEGSIQTTEITSGNLQIERGWVNVFSNISELDYPSIANINKDSQIAIEKGIQVFILFSTIAIGYYWIITIMRGSKGRN